MTNRATFASRPSTEHSEGLFMPVKENHVSESYHRTAPVFQENEGELAEFSGANISHDDKERAQMNPLSRISSQLNCIESNATKTTNEKPINSFATDSNPATFIHPSFIPILEQPDTSPLHTTPFLSRENLATDSAVQTTNADDVLWAWLTSEAASNFQDGHLFSDLTGDKLSSPHKSSYDPIAGSSIENGTRQVLDGFETTVSFAPLIVNGEQSTLYQDPGDPDANRINAAAWDTILHQNGIPSISNRMDWESFRQT